MAANQSIAKYSRHGSQLMQEQFRIYHQGGLDAYCQFYAIFNLINFLHFKRTQTVDFLGKSKFKAFLAIRDLPSFKRFFPKKPFGDENGMNARMLKRALCDALETAKLNRKAQIIQIEEDETVSCDDKKQKAFWLRIGVEKAFDSPHDVLGLAQVHEEKPDLEIGHCVVLIGKSHLETTKIELKDWDGIVLDSDRDYVYWKLNNTDPKKPYIEIARSDEKPLPPIQWISSFISVSLA